MSGRYRTIVADPPWPVTDYGARSLSTAGHWREDHTGQALGVPYQRMSIEEIAALPVNDLADTDAHLYVWAVNAYLTEAYDVVKAWGFRTRPVLLTWCKEPRGLGFGGTYANTTEFCLFTRRGSLPALRRWDSTWFPFKRPYVNGKPAHSVKPDGMQDVIEQVSPGPYLELFARSNRLGWDTWGNEALNHIDLGAAS
jgi:N6-adenosine-specific RNA methylase IME4